LSAFLDSNILLYAISSDARKAAIAGELIATGAIVSVQVLNEFANVASRKHNHPWPSIAEELRVLRNVLDVMPLTVEVHERGLELAQRYRSAWFDSLLLAAALQAGCTTFWSEDMQHGQVIEHTLTIRNPFA
jgi:predicted nucleic acid-binding protein